jgi:hypothetical protein
MNKTIKKVVIGLSVVGAMALTGCGGGGGGDNGSDYQPPVDVQPEPETKESWELIPYEDANKTKIDVLVLYSDGVDALYSGDAEARLTHLIAVTNEIANASRTGVELVVAKMQKYSEIDDKQAQGTVLSKATDDPIIAEMRDSAKADEVFIYRPYLESDNSCGYAWLNTQMLGASAFAHIAVDCQTNTTAHEFGHNMGNNHSHLQNGETVGGIFPYSTGHLIAGDFGTVMSYAESYGAVYKQIYSNPDLECNGQPCGIKEGEAGEADASRTIRETKLSVAEFRFKEGESYSPREGDQTIELDLANTDRFIAKLVPLAGYEDAGYYFVQSDSYASNRPLDDFFYIEGLDIAIYSNDAIEYLKTYGEKSYRMHARFNDANGDERFKEFTVTFKLKQAE